ncbi:MAG: hypothetical protein WC486_01160 [Candidatus Omnitrophota bacterium]
MKKKEIYEHLADIYLSSPKKKKAKSAYSIKIDKNTLFVSLATIAVFIVFISVIRTPRGVSSLALVVQPQAVKINYDLGVIKKEVYSLDLTNMDLSRFRAVSFAVRKSNPGDDVHLKLEMNSSFREVSEVYISGLKDKWQEFHIFFRDFKGISDWSRLTRISFVVEEWNTREKKGVVYIDDIKFLR